MAESLNVLLVVLGSARADHLSCYGYTRQTTPVTDALAREGVRFTAMIANAASALSGHASLFTGAPGVVHGATEEHGALAARRVVLAECFKAAGYRTAAFCTHPAVSPDTGFGRGFDAFFTQRYQNRIAARAVSLGRRASDVLLRRRDAGARRTNQALRRWLGASVQPFFAFVHYNELQLSADTVRAHDGPLLGHRPSAATTESIPALYDGALRYIDMRLGEIAEFLRRRGAWEQTVVVVTADHGAHLGARGLPEQCPALHDDLLRIPLIIRCPAVVPQGFAVDELAQTTDVFRTVLRLAGIRHDDTLCEGRALLDAARATPGPPFVVAERFRPDLSAARRARPDVDYRAYDVRMKAIRTRREKFVWRSDEANELYDLVSDPAEVRNLVEQDGARADLLRRQLFDWLAEVQCHDANDSDVGDLLPRMRERA
ncbi:MAG TPA: sulfatase [Candidatus Margulisiibacteriota bacterium]|nr:sulfatase [Candidatus Margulisiibacteriota bacterium]